MDYSAAIASALNAYHAHPNQANLDAVYAAVNAYQVNVGFLDDAFLDEIRALQATEATPIAPAKGGLSPVIVVGAIAAAVLLMSGGKSSSRMWS